MESFYLLGVGRKTVTTAGTAVPLVASSTPCSKVEITGIESNTDMIVVGNASVVAGTTLDGGGTRKGTPVSAGGTYTIYIDNVNKIYIDSVVNGEGVTFTYFK